VISFLLISPISFTLPARPQEDQMKEREAKQRLATSLGEVAYLEAGSPAKPPVLFVHGIPTSGYLWRHVLRFLQNDFHCYAPDLLGLGDSVPASEATPLHMEAQAEMLEEFMAQLGHESFAVVCHDQGGAAAQLLAARRPQLLDALVLTNCVAYDNWPVPAVARLQKLARLPGISQLLLHSPLLQWKEKGSWLSDFRRGLFDPKKLTDETIDEYLRPLRSSPEAQAAMVRFLLAGHARYTLRAVEGLKQFEKPTLVVWAADDHYLSVSWGCTLYEEIPGAKAFEVVPFCGHFWPEEKPAEFASLIGLFLAENLRRPKKNRTKSKARKAPKQQQVPVE
jgi:pimeloyl-ACP methyl ester carboxylesterase